VNATLLGGRYDTRPFFPFPVLQLRHAYVLPAVDHCAGEEQARSARDLSTEPVSGVERDRVDRGAGMGGKERRSGGGEVLPVVITPRALWLMILLCAMAGCTKQQAPQPPDPQAVLQQIPPADSAKYQHIHDMKNWRNPYLIVRADGVALFDVADSAEIVMKPDELLPALAKLPASNWPYGRVVAAAEAGAQSPSEQDRVAIRRNKGIVGGLLQGAQIAIDWVPSSK
jgi:hypothetical protein